MWKNTPFTVEKTLIMWKTADKLPSRQIFKGRYSTPEARTEPSKIKVKIGALWKLFLILNRLCYG
jgi:hypothetical protein